jgi:hypothetical protein
VHGSTLTLRGLAPGYRVLYTGILIFFMAGYAAGLVQQHLRASLSPAGVAAWYLGNADDPDADQLLFAKEGDEILDAVWRRSLAALLPGIVLVALLARATAPRGLRWTLAGGIVVLAIADVAAPAAVARGGRAWAVPAFAAQVGLAVAALAATVVCLRETLARRAEDPRVRRPDRHEAS